MCKRGYVRFTHKQAVKEDVNKNTKAAYDEIEQMIQKLHIHYHRLVASRECTAISHETHQENHFIAHLKTEKTWHMRSRLNLI